ncbi:MAG: hypothetical protein ACOCV2_04185 [Persicimonas sp.]
MNRLLADALLALRVVAAAVALIAISPLDASARDVDKELESELEEATEDYDMLMLGDAAKTLDAAIEKADKEDAGDEITANLYVMRAIVTYAESKDEDAVKGDFVSALEHDPDASIPSHYKSPNLEELFEEARDEVPDEPDEPDESDESDDGEEFEHDPVRTAQADEKVEIEAHASSDLPVYRVYIYLRPYGDDEFQQYEMEATSATRFAAELPLERIDVSRLDYYIEAVNRSREVIESSGSKDSPHEMRLLGRAGDESDDEDDSSKREVADQPDSGDADDGSSEQSMYVTVGGGTGIGFLPGGQPTAHPDRSVAAGLAPAFGHGLLEAGYMISDDAHLGLHIRWQFTPTQDFTNLPEESVGGAFPTTKDECLGLGLGGDCTVGLKYRWFMTNLNDLRIYSSTGAGVGRARHWLRLKENYYDGSGEVTNACRDRERLEEPGSSEFCYLRDTVRPGWAYFGLGAGLMWPVHDNVEVGLDSFLTFFFPETALNLDVNAAVNLRF